jgi:hypothetical protein
MLELEFTANFNDGIFHEIELYIHEYEMHTDGFKHVKAKCVQEMDPILEKVIFTLSGDKNSVEK